MNVDHDFILCQRGVLTVIDTPRKGLACLPVLVELGFVELAQKQYDEEGKPKRAAGTRARKAAPVIKKTKIVKAKAIFDDEPVELPKSNHYESEETKLTAIEKLIVQPVSNRNALLDVEDF